MERLSYLAGLLKHKYVIGILLICSVAYGAKFFDDIVTDGITVNDLTANRAVISNASNVLSSSTVTDTELGYVSGVTSALQTQLDAKLDDFASTSDNRLVGQMDSWGMPYRTQGLQLTIQMS